MWEDVARNGPWPGVPGPLELAGQPVAIGAGWLLAGTAAVLGIGAWLARRVDASAATGAAEPALSAAAPVFLRFDHRRVVVVGGGAVAAAKIPGAACRRRRCHGDRAEVVDGDRSRRA